MSPVAEPRGTRELVVRRPWDGKVLASVPVTSSDEVREAVEQARHAQEGWVRLDRNERFLILGGLAEVMTNRSEDLARTIRDETGKPLVEALAEILVSVELIHHYAEVAPRVLCPRGVPTGWLLGKSAWVQREPYGVVGVITPWNYPLLLAMDSVTAALFGGNAVVLKPSELTPLSSLAIGEVAAAAGLPDGLIQVVPGDGSTGAALVGGGVDKVVFTGSTATGRRVLARAAETLTPVTLELGGKDPAVVLEDADLDRAARGIVYGAFFNAGQTCLSTERVLVVAPVHDDLVERITELTRRLRASAEAEGDVGPLTSPDQLGIVEEHLGEALRAGARVTVGGGRLAPDSRVFEPTVLVDVTPAMKVAREETFGPLLPVLRVADEDEAVLRANEIPYGLFASVWTRDRSRGERLAARLRCGGVSINDTLSHYAVPGLPVGGVGDSGFGSRRGVAGLEEMTRPRSMLLHRVGGSRDPWWYPYTGRSARLVRALLELEGRRGVRGLLGALRHLAGKGSRT